MRRHSSVVMFALATILAACMTPDAKGGIITTLDNPTNGHTYHLLTQNTWTASQAEAAALGGNLVTINDTAENAWVFASFANFGGVERSLWIGFNDVASEGNFVWASGQTPLFTNWSGSQPDNGPVIGPENYVHMLHSTHVTPGAWNDFLDQSSVLGRPLHGVVEIAPAPEVAAVPEPSSLISATVVLVTLAGSAARRRTRREVAEPGAAPDPAT